MTKRYTIIEPSDTIIYKNIKDDEYLSLEEAQSLVGGNIEMRTGKRWFIFNEDGVSKNLEINRAATVEFNKDFKLKATLRGVVIVGDKYILE